MFLIYCIFFDKEKFGFNNNHYYIGQHHTNKIDDGYMGSDKKVGDIYRKYGQDKAQKTVLAITEDEQICNLLEVFYIKEYLETYGPKQVLNIAKGGKGISIYDRSYMIEAHKKTNAANRKLWKEHPERFLERNKKISEKMKGNKNGIGHTCKHSEETRRKISEAVRNCPTRHENLLKSMMKKVHVYKDGEYKEYESVKFSWKEIGFPSEGMAQKFIRYCTSLEDLSTFNYKFNFFASYNKFDVNLISSLFNKEV